MNEPTLMQIQQELEQSSAETAARRFWHDLRSEERKTNGEITSVAGHGPVLLKQSIQPLADSIKRSIKEARSGKSKRQMSEGYQMLKSLKPDTSAFIVARSVLNALGRPKRASVTTVTAEIGRLLDEERMLSEFKKDNPGLFVEMKKTYRSRNQTLDHQQKVVMREVRKREYAQKDRRTRIKAGAFCLNLFQEATGLCEVVRTQVGKHKTVSTVAPTNKALELFSKIDDRVALLGNNYLPMVVMPRPWTGLTGGGYMFPNPVAMPKLIKGLGSGMEGQPKLQPTLDAVNAVQETPWRINKKVLGVAKTLWELGYEIAGLPSPDPEPLPEKPQDIDTSPSALEKWKREAARVHDRNSRGLANRLKVPRTLNIACRFEEYHEVFFPHFLDFRGRMYSSVTDLSPQGCDLSKGLLEFSTGKPLETEEAACWLAIHGANVWGFDKGSLQDRIDWVREHEDRMRSIVEDPLGNERNFWADCDKPFQFLAFCFEWTGFRDEGFSFVSRIPVALDGSCNGLQHYAAMLRDPVAGEAVNLTPSEYPQDIYQRVADATTRILKDRHEEPLAMQWLSYGINRKTTKRPVMVLPYGGTKGSCTKFILEACDDRIKAGDVPPWGDEAFKAARYLTDIIWEAIYEVVTSAREAMAWLRDAAFEANDAIGDIGRPRGKHMFWTTPDGFVVHQAYRNYQSLRVRTQIGGSIVKVAFRPDDGKGVDKTGQKNGVAPNFVHSLDACAMRGYLRLAQEHGIQDFAMVHDSFGTHAADAPLSQFCIKQSFFQMYEESDPLESFRKETSRQIGKLLPAPPAKGSLDLESVLDSDYFFA